MLAEDALEGEAQPHRGTTGRLVEGVALPLIAAIAQIVEDMPRHHIHRISREPRALQGRRVPDMPHLDHTVARLDAEEARHTQRPPGNLVDDRVEQRIGGRGTLREPDPEGRFAFERPVRQILPKLRCARLRGEQLAGVPGNVHQLQTHELALERHPAQGPGRLPLQVHQRRC